MVEAVAYEAVVAVTAFAVWFLIAACPFLSPRRALMT